MRFWPNAEQGVRLLKDFSDREFDLSVSRRIGDHFGGAGKIKEVTGARVGMSLEDWQSVKKQQTSANGRNLGIPLVQDLILKEQRQPYVRRHNVQVLFHARPHGRRHFDRIPGEIVAKRIAPLNRGDWENAIRARVDADLY